MQRLDSSICGGPAALGYVPDDGGVVLVDKHGHGHASWHCYQEDLKRLIGRARLADVGLERVAEGRASDAREAAEDAAPQLSARQHAPKVDIDDKVGALEQAAEARVAVQQARVDVEAAKAGVDVDALEALPRLDALWQLARC